VLAHKLDLAVVTDPPAHPDLVIRPLRKDTVGFFSIEPKLSPKESILICDPQLKHTQILLGKLTRKRLSFRKTITSSSLDVIARLVASGVGTGILPANAIDSLNDRNVRLIEDLPKSHGEICLVFRHELMRLKAFQEMVRLILALDLSGA
jgi:DNA-binding transcriptional LysR family regulator